MHFFILAVLLLSSDIALAESYTCEAIGVDRVGVLRVDQAEGRNTLFRAFSEAQPGAMRAREVVMIYIRGSFIGAFIVGPQSNEPDAGMVGWLDYSLRDDLIHIPLKPEGLTARIGSLTCIFKQLRSVTEEAAAAPLIPEE